jgi:CBS-domain-containing membrane protein|tara:strand:- start:1479 stop:1952 length:474 start_codon:yes stop_codon:yes gene_type:complete
MIFDKKFKDNYISYILQSALAGLTIVVVMLFLNITNQSVIIAALGATAFIVFAMPNSNTAKFRNVVGGHFIGILSGFIFFSLPTIEIIQSSYIHAFAVSLAVLLMVVTDTEHPPAAATALGISTAGFSYNLGLFTLISALILATTHFVLKPWLKDLV